MDDREINAVTRISPTGKMAVGRPAVGRRELAYKLKLFESTRKKGEIDPDERKRKLAQLAAESEAEAERQAERLAERQRAKDWGGDLQGEDFVADIKRRFLFDRSMIIGDDRY